MKNSDVQSGPQPPSHDSKALHGAHLRTLEALFRHPTSHNLEWQDVLSLIGSMGAVQVKGNNKLAFEVDGQRLVMPEPHSKDLTAAEVVDVRHFLQRAGRAPDARAPATAPQPAAAMLMVVVDHHDAKIYRIDASGNAAQREIRPYDPHHFLHHLTHKGQLREQGQRAPEDPAYYGLIAAALAGADRIIVVGHGTGKSNAAEHLLEYLRTHHRDTYQRVVREIAVDLSAITPPQLLSLAEHALAPAP
ncbi:MAG TPA: hypothetical protein VK803_09000 [Steroidobacteraceae bacterium]|jgi:hypothetical protein|nr:hypothetical protein [Steroidobacteraceae bacterium]